MIRVTSSLVGPDPRTKRSVGGLSKRGTSLPVDVKNQNPDVLTMPAAAKYFSPLLTVGSGGELEERFRVGAFSVDLVITRPERRALDIRGKNIVGKKRIPDEEPRR
jgi:hypothetical protein